MKNMFKKVISNSFLVFFSLLLQVNAVQGDDWGSPCKRYPSNYQCQPEFNELIEKDNFQVFRSREWYEREIAKIRKRREERREREKKRAREVRMKLLSSPEYAQRKREEERRRIDRIAEEDDSAYCEVLQTSFFGSTPVQVQCGEGPEGMGWVSNRAPIQAIALKLRDRDTGQERILFQSTLAGPKTGSFSEKLGQNIDIPAYSRSNNDKIPIGSRLFSPMPIGLFIPGGCGSNKIFNALTFDLFKDNNEFFKEDEECSWLNENDTNWRSAVQGIGENEDILYVRYLLPPDTPIYHSKDGKELKGPLSTFYTQSSRDDLYCESLEDPLVLNYPSIPRRITGLRKCDTDTKKIPMCIGRSAWCSAPNTREHFEFLRYGCKTLADGSCPSTTDCILGEDSFYSNIPYMDHMRTMNTQSDELQKPFYHLQKRESFQPSSGDR